MQNTTTLPSGETAIADALNAIWEIVGDEHPRRDDPEGLQRLIHHLLDRRPASSFGELEHRLLSLASALQVLGPWATDNQVLSEAERLSNRLN